MRILYFSNLVTVIIDFAAWFILHMSIAFIGTKLPLSVFNSRAWLFRKRKWENNGSWYQETLKVKQWKNRLPDGAVLFSGGFSKGKIAGKGDEYLRMYLLETCRGELVHWIVFFISPIFFLWNPPWAGMVMILYAFLSNMPCIVAQRYNRFHIEKILNKQQKSN